MMREEKTPAWQTGAGVGAAVGIIIEIGAVGFIAASPHKNVALALGLLIVLTSATIGGLVGCLVGLLTR